MEARIGEEKRDREDDLFTISSSSSSSTSRERRRGTAGGSYHRPHDDEEIYGYVEIGKSLQVFPLPFSLEITFIAHTSNLSVSSQDLKSTLLNYYQQKSPSNFPSSFVNIHLSTTNLQNLTSRIDGIEKTVNLYSAQDSFHQKNLSHPLHDDPFDPTKFLPKTPIDETPEHARPLYPPKISPLDLPEKV
jgi:hypothetical protein